MLNQNGLLVIKMITEAMSTVTIPLNETISFLPSFIRAAFLFFIGILVGNYFFTDKFTKLRKTKVILIAFLILMALK